MTSVQQDRNRAAYMDYLYTLYKRDTAVTGLKSTLTGLADKHRLYLGTIAMKEEVDQWHKQEVRDRALARDKDQSVSVNELIDRREVINEAKDSD